MNQRERAIAEDPAGQQVVTAASRAAMMKRVDRARKTEVEILKGIEAARLGGHDILFPSYRTLSSLAELTVVEDLKGYKSTDAKVWTVGELLPHGKVRPTFSSYCSVNGCGHHISLDVKPRQKVVEVVEERMLLSDGYRINLEVIVRDNGTALVCARYNLISGSRWLAIIHSDSIPGVGR